MKPAFWTAAVLLTAGCAGMFDGEDGELVDFDKETSAVELRVKEDRARSSLAKMESSLSDYTKSEKAIPEKLERLIPKFLAAIPPLDLPACGSETAQVEYYGSSSRRVGKIGLKNSRLST